MKVIFSDIAKTLYGDTIQSFIFAFMATMLLILVRRIGIRKSLHIWFEAMKKSKKQICRFLFFFYLYLLAARTLFNRQMIWSGWSDVLGGWKIEKLQDGTISYEAVENVLLFIPLALLFYLAFDRAMKSRGIKITVIHCICLGFCASLFIEMNQLLFRIGTFQIADLVYNVAGGVIGYVIYQLINLFRGDPDGD